MIHKRCVVSRYMTRPCFLFGHKENREKRLQPDTMRHSIHLSCSLKRTGPEKSGGYHSNLGEHIGSPLFEQDMRPVNYNSLCINYTVGADLRVCPDSDSYIP